MTNRPNKSNEPIFFVAPDDEIIENWEETFELLSKEENNTLVIDIQPELVENLDVITVQEFVMVLQHYPELIDKFIFSLKLNFPEITGSELYLPEEHWKNDPKYYRWFHKMNSFGVMLFFLHDSESRFFFIAGDLLADEKLKFESTPGSKKAFIDIQGENMQIVCDRVFTSCWLFMIYCHALNFDPKFAIESMISDFGLPISYDDVNNKYLQDIKTGFYLRLKKAE